VVRIPGILPPPIWTIHSHFEFFFRVIDIFYDSRWTSPNFLFIRPFTPAATRSQQTVSGD
jgi:hypothetical protein